MKEPDYVPIVKYIRNGLAEQVHFGLVIHMNKKGIISKAGEDNSYKFYHRSCMKPLQAAALIDLEIDKKYGLSLEELALCCASHTGDVIHQNIVLSILNKTGFTPEDLLLKPHKPLSVEEQKRLIKNNFEVTSIHNNCSGKHAAMLAICKEKNFPLKNYKDFENPLSSYIINNVCNLCETDLSEVVISKDGCGLPVIATTLEQLGRGFLNLFLNPKYEKLKQAFLQYPFLIGGKNRLDSDIINSDKKNILIAKVGACGLCVVVNILKQECIVVKVADSNMEARAITVIEALNQLKWPDCEFSGLINNIYSKDIYSQDCDLLGYINPCFKLS